MYHPPRPPLVVSTWLHHVRMESSHWQHLAKMGQNKLVTSPWSWHRSFQPTKSGWHLAVVHQHDTLQQGGRHGQTPTRQHTSRSILTLATTCRSCGTETTDTRHAIYAIPAHRVAWQLASNAIGLLEHLECVNCGIFPSSTNSNCWNYNMWVGNSDFPTRTPHKNNGSKPRYSTSRKQSQNMKQQTKSTIYINGNKTWNLMQQHDTNGSTGGATQPLCPRWPTRVKFSPRTNSSSTASTSKENTLAGGKSTRSPRSSYSGPFPPPARGCIAWKTNFERFHKGQSQVKRSSWSWPLDTPRNFRLTAWHHLFLGSAEPRLSGNKHIAHLQPCSTLVKLIWPKTPKLQQKEPSQYGTSDQSTSIPSFIDGGRQHGHPLQQSIHGSNKSSHRTYLHNWVANTKQLSWLTIWPNMACSPLWTTS